MINEVIFKNFFSCIECYISHSWGLEIEKLSKITGTEYLRIFIPFKVECMAGTKNFL